MMDRLRFTISYVEAPQQYLLFKITNPEKSKNSKNKDLLAFDINWPCTFLSFKIDPSLAFVSPIRYTFPSEENFKYAEEK